MVARWYYDNQPAAGAVIIRLHWDQDGQPVATLLPPPAFAEIADVVAISGTPMDVPAAFGAGVFLSLREEVRLRVTGDRTVWQAKWGVLEDVGDLSVH